MSRPEAPLAHGQWRYCGRSRLRVRQAEMEAGEVLLAASDGSFHAAGLSGLRLDAGTVPDDDALRTLRAMGHGLRDHVVGRGWLQWLDEPPLMPPSDEVLDETEMEQELKKRLGHLEAVCRRPRTHLHLEEERQLVARCRRPSPRAPMELAARSEDWERRTLWGVRPKRVLGMVREDLYDLYENRLTVALVDRLDEALIQRIRAVRRIVLAARSMEEWREALEGGNYVRAVRVSELWGSLWNDQGLLKRAEEALRRLTLLRRRVLGLKDSLLYKQLGGHRRSIGLRMTNVFVHDGLYRAVAELWQAWERHVREGVETAQSRWLWEQEAASGFDLFAALVVARALEALRLDPVDLEAPFGPGSALQLDGACGPVELTWSGETLEIRAPHTEGPLRIVGLPSMLEGSARPERWLETLPLERLLVLHLATDEPRAPRHSRVVLNGPGPGKRWPLFVPIAPWELESVERVARALRWVLWGALYAAFPPTVARPARPWEPPAGKPDWIAVEDDHVHILEPPKNGTGWPQLQQRIDDNEVHIHRVQRRLATLDPKKRGDRKQLRHQLQQHTDARDRDLALQTSLDEGAQRIRRLLPCPVCPSECTPWDFETVDGRFRLKCKSCGAQWGLRDCRACGRRFPYIRFQTPDEGLDVLDVDCDLGCDVLAFPVEPDVFLCTRCGARSDGAET